MSDPASQTLLLTGGRGRLATLIADHFATGRHRLRLFSRVAAEGFEAVSALRDPTRLRDADVLLHLAWSTLPATSEASPGVEFSRDLPDLAAMLDALAATPAERRPLFVFFSSGGAVYGDAPGRPSREEDPLRPVGGYGRGKVAAERLIEERAERHGLPCCVLRISNPYGYPVPKSRAQGLVPHAFRCAMENQSLALWGDGSARKDFLYYTDFLGAIEAVIQHRLNGTYNLAAGESHQVNEVLAAIEEHTGRGLRVDSRPAPAWDVRDSRLDNARLIAASGWRPRISLAEGIRRTAVAYGSS